MNPLPAILWNLHKRYLDELASEGLPVVPTTVVPHGAQPDWDALFARHGDLVLKPAISAGSFATVRVRAGEAAEARLRRGLESSGLGRIVNARNPVDLTPMANEAMYEEATRALLESDEVDAVIVGIVPLTAMLKTVPGELEADDALPARLGRCFEGTKKPLVAVVDSGPAYEPLVRALRKGGLPVFRSSDQAVRSLGRYLQRRA